MKLQRILFINRHIGQLALLSIVALLLCGLPLNDATADQLYAYRSGTRGTITFTTKKPTGRKYWKVKPGKSRYSTIRRRRGRGGWRAIPVKSRFDPVIFQLAKSHRLEPALVKAVVHVESAFRPRVRSPAGAQGLMQLMPATAKRFGVRNPFHPPENILGGVRYLRWLYNHFNGNVAHVLAGYNAGENAVKRYGGVPPYNETQQYVRRVLKMRDLYRCDFSGKHSCRTRLRKL